MKGKAFTLSLVILAWSVDLQESNQTPTCTLHLYSSNKERSKNMSFKAMVLKIKIRNKLHCWFCIHKGRVLYTLVLLGDDEQSEIGQVCVEYKFKNHVCMCREIFDGQTVNLDYWSSWFLLECVFRIHSIAKYWFFLSIRRRLALTIRILSNSCWLNSGF